MCAGENPEEGFVGEYGNQAIDAERGPLVFHPPLVLQPWMEQYPHKPFDRLLQEWEEQSRELKIDFSRAGPEINTSRADWEKGNGGNWVKVDPAYGFACLVCKQTFNLLAE